MTLFIWVACGFATPLKSPGLPLLTNSSLSGRRAPGLLSSVVDTNGCPGFRVRGAPPSPDGRRTGMLSGRRNLTPPSVRLPWNPPLLFSVTCRPSGRWTSKGPASNWGTEAPLSVQVGGPLRPEKSLPCSTFPSFPLVYFCPHNLFYWVAGPIWLFDCRFGENGG